MLSQPELSAPPTGRSRAIAEHRLAFGDAEVPYLSGMECTPELADAILRRLGDVDALLFVVDAGVGDHADRMVAQFSRRVQTQVLSVRAAEPEKTLGTVQAIMDAAVARGLTRRSTVVAMGGGTVGNIAGLAAALLFRGTRLVQLPTTPVAAFDATVSIKQGVNLAAAKNLCGTYFAPALIGCDLQWLTTVPRPELLTGLAEMVKNVLITAPELESKLTEAIDTLSADPGRALGWLLEIGIQAKVPYLRADPRERREALVFEYGHTAGHAIEFASGGAIGHGEAVAWGMLAAAEVARRRHGLSAADVETHHRLVAQLDLPDPGARLAGLERAALRTVLEADNKRGYAGCGPDEVLMVLLREVGRPYGVEPAGAAPITAPPLLPVPTEALLDAIETIRRKAGRQGTGGTEVSTA